MGHMKIFKRALVTVLDSLNQTTMPYNEFILYRNKNYPNEQQIVILTGSEITIPKNEIPCELIIYRCGKNPIKIRRALKDIRDFCANNSLEMVIHLHSIRGALSTFIAMLGVVSRKRSVYTIHSTFTGYKFHNKIISFVDGCLAYYVTCVSNVSYEKFPSILKKFKGDRIRALQNGVNIERIDNDLRNHVVLKKQTAIVTFVYIARMVALKNHKFLVDVMSALKDKNIFNIRFMFIGEEEDGGKTRLYVHKKGVQDFIAFTGLIPRKDVYNTIANADAYLSSSTLEGLPVAVLEAMYCGLPAILSDIPQHREVAKGCEGVSTVPFNVDMWVNKIMRIVNMGIEERIMKGLICKKHVERDFSLEAMHYKYDEIYDNLL